MDNFESTLRNSCIIAVSWIAAMQIQIANNLELPGILTFMFSIIFAAVLSMVLFIAAEDICNRFFHSLDICGVHVLICAIVILPFIALSMAPIGNAIGEYFYLLKESVFHQANLMPSPKQDGLINYVQNLLS